MGTIDELTIILKKLRLSGVLETLDIRMREATESNLSHDEFLFRLLGDEACGAHAINGLMLVAERYGLEVRTLDVRNSGDTAGDRSSVVGYGAYALS